MQGNYVTSFGLIEMCVKHMPPHSWQPSWTSAVTPPGPAAYYQQGLLHMPVYIATNHSLALLTRRCCGTEIGGVFAFRPHRDLCFVRNRSFQDAQNLIMHLLTVKLSCGHAPSTGAQFRKYPPLGSMDSRILCMRVPRVQAI